MNTQNYDDERVRDDLEWLAQRAVVATRKEECYFCNTIREMVARGWALMDARSYAIGKLMGTHSW